MRGLVAALLANKPMVLPDQAFARDLRAKLLVAHSTQSVVAKPILSAWFMYLAPVGVVVVLLLMMVPKPLSHQVIPTMINENKPLDSVPETAIEDIGGDIDAKRSFSAPEATPAADTSVMKTMATPALLSSDTFNISTQLPGQLIKVDFVFFNEPTLLVIQKDRQGNPGEVIGVSQVLVGNIEGVEIALMQKMLIDETFFATAYLDNGDGIYTPNKDTPVFDASGTLSLQQAFSVSPF